MKVLLTKEGNSVVVTPPMAGMTAEDLLKLNPGGRIVDTKDLPQDREFRDAWTIEGKIDLAKAKEIWKRKIRIARNKKLEELDVKWAKAFERGDVKIAASYATEKQVLRDLTEREELTKAKSVEQLRKFWPSVLD